ncbi:YcnI family protein [Promicromonospora aerolata]|uniref:YcnI family protein n=1 Tax=Promicromonospora aerolata TaxID=195749 RepID=A0ABW4V860_9MICO
MKRTTAVRRVILSGLAAAGLVALGATSAMAHVTITPSTTAAGATTVLRVEVPHGCEGSATTAVSIRMPEGVADVTASSTGRWTVDQTPDALTYTTEEPLQDGEHDEVELSLRLPETAGTTLVFPVVQRCEQGEVAWTEVAEHDEGHDALDRPAPVVVVTSAEAGAGAGAETEPGADTDTDTETEAGAEAAGAATGAEERRPLLVYGAAGVLAAGGLAGGAVLLRRRRNR